MTSTMKTIVMMTPDAEGGDKMLRGQHHAETATLKASLSSQVDPYTPADAEAIEPEKSQSEVPVASTMSRTSLTRSPAKKDTSQGCCEKDRSCEVSEDRRSEEGSEAKALQRRRPR